ncbi:hypothetical protein BDV96DRAFT_592300 [Lophiotrema nucula]|uniref:Uncharacterized protein n=1 Tax=Lophiotrema nucula TaxID=690887 RepID=A0A6A5YFS7_9PLEO|nr:hypothetical protein BDV96DRAFT_592300 [Lophiotrema nucula]
MVGAAVICCIQTSCFQIDSSEVSINVKTEGQSIKSTEIYSEMVLVWQYDSV